MKRSEHDTAFAIGYVIFGFLLMVLMNSWWETLFAIGMLSLALVEYMGGEDSDRNYLFIILFAILGIGIVFGGSMQYWILVAGLGVWGAYEVIEERKIQPNRWSLVGIMALVVSAIIFLGGALDYTFTENSQLAMALGILFCIQGLKEWFD